MKLNSKSVRGFTLIELLIVIAIIGILSTIVIVNLSSGKAKARDAERIQELRQVQNALELYRSENKVYPSTGGIGSWRGNCSTFGSHGTTGALGYIPNLAPKYIPVLPLDPKPEADACYLYTSNGTDYMLLAYKTVEEGPISINLQRVNANPPASITSTYAIYSSGAAGW